MTAATTKVGKAADGSVAFFLNHFPVVTFLVVAFVAVATVKAISGDVTLNEYAESVLKFAGGVGVLGVARGLAKR